MGEGVPRPQLSLQKVRYLKRFEVSNPLPEALRRVSLSWRLGQALLLIHSDGCSAPAILSAAVEILLVTYVDRETVRCPPNTRPSLGPLCRPAIR